VNRWGRATRCFSGRIPTTAGTLSNTAAATTTAGDTNPSNNTSTTTTTVNVAGAGAADLMVTKSANPNPVVVGQALSYTITVSNLSGNPATGSVLTDQLPSGVTFVSATSSQGTVTQSGGTVTANLGTVTNGTNATVTINVIPTTAGTLSNTAAATTTAGDTNPSNNVSTTTTVNVPGAGAADLLITKSANPTTGAVGQNLTYTLTVTNLSNNPATGSVVTDVLPAGVTFVSVSSSQGTATQSNGIVTANLGTVNNGTPATVTLIVTPTTAGTVTNTATATTTAGDVNPANNTASLTTTINPVTDLQVTKSVNSSQVTVGQNVVYTITVSNLSSTPAVGSTLTDNLPSGVTFVSGTTSQGTLTHSGNNVSVNLGTVNSGSPVTITLTATANAAGTVNNTASASSTTAENNLGNNTSSASFTATAATTTPPSMGPITNECFVEQIYRDLLGREADQAGLTFFTNQLDQGKESRFDVVLNIEESAEFRMREVSNLYTQLLHRGVDPTGLATWTNFLAQGNTAQDLEAIILGSPEYFTNRGGGTNMGWLQAVYQDVLNRAIDPTGLQSWTQDLANGFSRARVAQLILSSPESDMLEVQTSISSSCTARRIRPGCRRGRPSCRPMNRTPRGMPRPAVRARISS
jgi:uncharacterized repeat protein (TIGR01451 family)